jgi:hypothetical protein
MLTLQRERREFGMLMRMWGWMQGCVGMFFALSDSLLCYVRGSDDVLNQFAAGSLAGVVSDVNKC